MLDIHMVLKFNIGDKVVYPTHGVGEIINIESKDVLGTIIKFYVVLFNSDKLKISIPINRAQDRGLRPIIDDAVVQKVYEKLQVKMAANTNKMWCKKSQLYEHKVNSGDVLALAEVISELHNNINKDRSYGERTLYNSAFNRLALEVSILEKISAEQAKDKLRVYLDSK